MVSAGVGEGACALDEGSSHKPVIGLLGAPGAGKSAAAHHFATLGCAVIDADILAKEALEEPEVRERIVEWWGPGMLNGQGRVDRKRLADVVFNDDSALKRLESLTHPRVHAKRAELRQKYEADPAVKAIVEDCPLLLETELDQEMDVLVFVDAPPAVRQQRLRASRGWSAGEIDRREKNQLPLDTKRARADYVVNNGASERICIEEVTRVLSLITHE